MIVSQLTPKRWAAITPSDSDRLERCIGLRAGAAGVIVAGFNDGSTVTFGAVAAGEIIPGEFTKVLSSGSGTTVTPILGAFI